MYCVCDRGQAQMVPFFFEIRSLSGLEMNKKARLAVQ